MFVVVGYLLSLYFVPAYLVGGPYSSFVPFCRTLTWGGVHVDRYPGGWKNRLVFSGLIFGFSEEGNLEGISVGFYRMMVISRALLVAPRDCRGCWRVMKKKAWE